MIHLKANSLLPLASYVPFIAHKVNDAEIFWRNNATGNEIDLLDHVYSSRVPGQNVEVDHAVARTYLADRYGGTGIGSCGGSARCGIFSGVQVKGIGLTPLHAFSKHITADRWHQDGLLSLGDAVKEAIWSSICESALPYGAVTTFGILVIGHRHPYRQGCTEGSTSLRSRALLLRPEVVRPAHFLRNAAFTIEKTSAIGASTDLERTKSAIERLPDVFSAILRQTRESSSIRVLNEGMLEAARRMAAQIAAAFAKRLFHRALGCSNIALDGRYLDFGTMTAIDGYRRMAGSPSPGGPDQWNQHVILRSTLAAMRKQVALNLASSDLARVISEEELLGCLEGTLSWRTEIEFVKLFGLNEDEVVSIPQDLRKKVYGVIQDLYGRGGDERFTSRRFDDPEVQSIKPVATVGRYDVNRLLRRVAAATTTEEKTKVLEDEIDDVALARRFVAVQCALLEVCKDIDGATNGIAAARRRLKLQAKRNASLSFISGDAIDVALGQLSPTPEGVSAYIDSTVRKAREIVAI